MAYWWLYAVGAISSRRERSLFLGPLPIGCWTGHRFVVSLQRCCPVVQEGKLLMGSFPQETLYCLHCSLDLTIGTGEIGARSLVGTTVFFAEFCKSLETNCGPPSLRICHVCWNVPSVLLSLTYFPGLVASPLQLSSSRSRLSASRFWTQNRRGLSHHHEGYSGSFCWYKQFGGLFPLKVGAFGIVLNSRLDVEVHYWPM